MTDSENGAAARNGGIECATPRELSPSQLIAVAALLAGKTQVQAAKLAGVDDRTIRLWLQKSEFRLALREGRDALLREMTTALHARARAAVDTLSEVMRSRKADGHARVNAARTLMEMTVRTAETSDHVERLRDLEEAVARREAETPD
jgi:hypothetical protein